MSPILRQTLEKNGAQSKRRRGLPHEVLVYFGRGQGLAGQAPTLSSALHPHQIFLAHYTRAMVERFFRDITHKRIRCGVFTSVAELERAINDYIAVHNAKPKPFIWTAKASDILAKVTRARAVLTKSTSN